MGLHHEIAALKQNADEVGGRGKVSRRFVLFELEEISGRLEKIRNGDDGIETDLVASYLFRLISWRIEWCCSKISVQF